MARSASASILGCSWRAATVNAVGLGTIGGRRPSPWACGVVVRRRMVVVLGLLLGLDQGAWRSGGWRSQGRGRSRATFWRSSTTPGRRLFGQGLVFAVFPELGRKGDFRDLLVDGVRLSCSWSPAPRSRVPWKGARVRHARVPRMRWIWSSCSRRGGLGDDDRFLPGVVKRHLGLLRDAGVFAVALDIQERFQP